ncbi:MAG: O-antigen ligase family protein [Bacteroidetes bacterium]|nr:O-antigen ligase family protein [Bacteroidota bacterium]
MKALFTRLLKDSSAERAAWFLVWFSLPFSLKMTSAGIILVSSVILVSFLRRPFGLRRREIWYLCLPVVFFLWYAKELLWVRPFLPVWKETEQMLSLLVIPALFTLTRIRKDTFTKIAMTALASALAISGMVMLVAAASRFVHSGNYDEFTYHTLAGPFHTGAIYFSFYLLFVLFKLDDPDWMEDHRRLKAAIAVFFIFLLLLSASKLMIGLGFPLLAWHYRRFISQGWNNYRNLSVVLMILVAIGSAPFLKRSQVLIHPNLEMVTTMNFKNCPEPNGLNLRLVFWRFGIQVLDEQHAWITGVGMNRSRALLNQKFRQYGLYMGTGVGTDTGYLNYNYHNQFVETLVRAGIPGLVILILILVTFAVHSGGSRFTPGVFIWMIIVFFITESVLGRQAGLVFFCLVYSANFINENQMTIADDEH